MLGLGKSDPAKDVQSKLDDARDRRAKHVARRDAAVELVGERREELQQAAASAAPDAALDKAEGKLAAAERRVETLEKAIADCDREIADYETKLAAIVDGNQRSETARKLEALVADIVECEAKFYTICEKLNGLAAVAATVVPEAAGIDIYLKGTRAELPAAWELVVSVLRGRARGVLAGHGPAELLQHPAAAPAPIVTAHPQTASVFVTKPVKWLDERGQLRTAPAWFDAMLPADLAKTAIALGAAISPQHEIAKSSQNARRDFIMPDPAKCIALNDTGEPAPAETAPGDAGANRAAAAAGAPFTPLDRGKPYHVSVGGPER
jgi:hypothetical protein